jgi:hypothetical protein
MWLVVELKKNFKLSDELPKVIEKYKTLGVSELHRLLLQDYNKDVSTQSINMYFMRHPEIRSNYEQVFNSAAASQVEVNGEIFKNGNFAALPTIQKWNREKATLVSVVYQASNVNAIKNLCKGVFYTKDHVTKKLTEHHIEGWTPKTPERLTLDQCQEYRNAVAASGCGTKGVRIAIRDFFLSRDSRTLKPSEMSGDMPKIGKWKHAHIEKVVIDKILEHVRSRNYQAFVADLFMFKTATRSASAFSCCLKSNLHTAADGTTVLTVLDKGFHRKGRKEWDKIITADLLEHLNALWLEHGNNAFEGLTEETLRGLNKDAYQLWLEPNSAEYDLAMTEPNHVWRHAFGGHMLRATKWNYDLVAYLGGWDSTDMLKKVYGAPPMDMIRKLGLEFIPTI